MGIYDDTFSIILHEDIRVCEDFKRQIVVKMLESKARKIAEDTNTITFERNVFLDFPAPLQYIKQCTVEFCPKTKKPRITVQYTVTPYPFLAHWILAFLGIHALLKSNYIFLIGTFLFQPVIYWYESWIIKRNVMNFFKENELLFLRSNDPNKGTLKEKKY